ncbi:MAG: hypothetical protein V7L29_30730 [Nostoc sp.]
MNSFQAKMAACLRVAFDAGVPSEKISLGILLLMVMLLGLFASFVNVRVG